MQHQIHLHKLLGAEDGVDGIKHPSGSESEPIDDTAVLVGQPQDLAGESRIFEWAGGGGLRENPCRMSAIVRNEARIVRIIGWIGCQITESDLRRCAEQIDAVIELIVRHRRAFSTL